MKIQENGPWVVSNWRDGRIAIQSDDFYFDAALEVSGDFGSLEVKRAYAVEICRRLNAMNPTPPNVELTGRCKIRPIPLRSRGCD